MSTAIRRSVIGLTAVLALSAMGTTAAQAQGNFSFTGWMQRHPIVSTSQAPAEVDGLPSTVYLLGSRATVAHVEERLLDLGFTSVRGVSRSGAIYAAEAMWDGRRVDLRIDGRNGRITALPG